MAESGKLFLSEAALNVPHEGHDHHLCELRKTLTVDQYKKLIRGAKYCCKHCGRSAEKGDSLCFPEEL